MSTERIQVVDSSMSQVISFRFSDSEAEALSARQQPGESLNQAAQRLLKEALGLSTTVDVVDIDSRIAAQLEPILLELAQLKSEIAGKYVA